MRVHALRPILIIFWRRLKKFFIVFLASFVFAVEGEGSGSPSSVVVPVARMRSSSLCTVRSVKFRF